MAYLRLNRRARWNTHRRECERCSSWSAAQADWPVCTRGRRALAAVREASAAAAALERQLSRPAAPAGTLW